MGLHTVPAELRSRLNVKMTASIKSRRPHHSPASLSTPVGSFEILSGGRGRVII